MTLISKCNHQISIEYPLKVPYLAVMVHVHLGHELEDLRLGGVVAQRPQQRAKLLRADIPAVVLNIQMIRTIINI